MRLHEIANTIEAPAIVHNPQCGIFILLPDCQLLNLNWRRLSVEEQRVVRYNSEWVCIKVGRNVFMEEDSNAEND